MEWSVNITDDDTRTMSEEELVSEFLQGNLDAEDTFVWQEGMDDWIPLGQADAIQTAIAAKSAAPAGPAAAFEGTALTDRPDEASFESFQKKANPATPEPTAEERMLGERGESSSLFSLEALESTVAVPQPSERDSALDLMGSGGPSLGLFDAPDLTKAPPPAPPKPKPKPAPTASAKAAAAPVAASAPARSPVATPRVEDPPAEQGGKKGLTIAAVAAVVLLGGGIGAYALSQGDPPPETAETSPSDPGPGDVPKETPPPSDAVPPPADVVADASGAPPEATGEAPPTDAEAPAAVARKPVSSPFGQPPSNTDSKKPDPKPEPKTDEKKGFDTGAARAA
ncbi:MAG: GYF domain-containing protein, partial [Myxococcota bacterium]